MQSTTTSSPAIYGRGDVVLVPFPFTNLNQVEKRPAVIVNIENYQRRNTDILIAPITSQVQNQRFGDHTIVNWQQAGLVRPSLVRAKVAAVRASMVRSRLGHMPAADLAGIEVRLRHVMAL